MGRWGYQTHARDYYMDMIERYGLNEDNQHFKDNHFFDINRFSTILSFHSFI